MNKEQLSEKIFTALGTASMCWSETPTGIFDSTLACEIGNKLVDEIYPHLLNEGEKKQTDWKEHTKLWMEAMGDDPKDFPYKPELLAADNTAISGQNWEKVAEELIKKHNGPDFTIDPKELKKALAALTEMAELAYERGREEEHHYLVRTEIHELQEDVAELQQQLAEKEKECLILNGGLIEYSHELTAAKAEITKLQQQNYDLELALRNL